MSVTLSLTPWMLLLGGLPLLAALGARLSPQGLQRPLVGLGFFALLATTVRVLLAYDLRVPGYQLGAMLPTPLGGLVWGVDGWTLAALPCLLLCAVAAGLLDGKEGRHLPGLLAAAALGAMALCAASLPALWLCLAGALLALRALGAVEVGALLLCLLGTIWSGSDTMPLVAVPLLSVGLGLLAIRQPDPRDPGAGGAAGMLLRIAALGPAAILGHARLVTAEMPEAALVWTQVTSSAGALICVGMGLRALGAPHLTGIAGAGASVLLAAAYTGIGAARMDAWNGLVLLALSAAPAAGLLLVAAADLPRTPWRRLRGAAAQAQAQWVRLGGLALAGAPFTPGFAAWLLLSLGAWQSPWWQSAWWSAGALLGAWLVGLAALRAATALARPAPALLSTPPAAPPRRWPGPILLGGLLLTGVWPSLLLTGIDHSSAEHLPRMVEAIGALMEGTLGNILPAWLKRWWL